MKSKIAEKCSQLPPKSDWIGRLAEFQDDYTSVELQEKVSDWIVASALGKLTKKRKEPAEALK